MFGEQVLQNSVSQICLDKKVLGYIGMISLPRRLGMCAGTSTCGYACDSRPVFLQLCQIPPSDEMAPSQPLSFDTEETLGVFHVADARVIIEHNLGILNNKASFILTSAM